MKHAILLCAALLCTFELNAQLTTLPDGGNYKATVAEQVGLTQVAISYSRPGVKGREGKIWGTLIHEGFAQLGYGNGKPCPWRAGANENTTIEFSTDVLIEGKPLPAGKYGFFIAYGPAECTLIFSRNATSWGSFFYEEAEDALRVKVRPVAMPLSTERLSYSFTEQDDSSATIALTWEKLSIPFRLSTHLQQIQLASIRAELRSDKGFLPQSWQQAAGILEQSGQALEEALTDINVAEQSLKTFNVYMTKANILKKLNRIPQADSAVNMAINVGAVYQLHNYARNLLNEKKPAAALNVFAANYKKNGANFTTNVGMARGLSAMGNYKEALKYASKALPLSPDALNKTSVEGMIAKLKEGKDINS
jgi:tetratricopeptide (TPR) repeat protein